MPLHELKQYTGRNPRPADHDSYWDRALAEMHATDPMVELVPHAMNAPYAECFDMYFTGVRGARIHAKYVRPARPRGKHPAVLQFHGYSVNSGEWSEKLKWAALGFSVAALDCRGQGGLSEDTGGVKGTTLRGHIIRGLDDTPDNLLFRHVFLDTAELARIVMDMPDVDPDRVGATGGSQGGGLTIACAALEPRVRRAFPVFPFLSDYLRVWEMDLAVRGIRGACVVLPGIRSAARAGERGVHDPGLCRRAAPRLPGHRGHVHGGRSHGRGLPSLFPVCRI